MARRLPTGLILRTVSRSGNLGIADSTGSPTLRAHRLFGWLCVLLELLADRAAAQLSFLPCTEKGQEQLSARR